MSQHFTEPHSRSGGNFKVQIDLFNYTMKAKLKGRTVIDTSTLASETDFASLKTNVDILDVDKLKTVPADFSKPSLRKRMLLIMMLPKISA